MKAYSCMEDVRRRIDLNYQFIKELEKSLDACEGDEEKLELLQLIGCGCSEYITGAYSSNILEREIVKIGQIIEFSPEEKPQNGKILHVMTRAGKAGGHSTIVYNWIKNDKKRQYSIVFTDMEYWDIPKFILQSVEKTGGTILCLHGNFLEKQNSCYNFHRSLNVLFFIYICMILCRYWHIAIKIGRYRYIFIIMQILDFPMDFLLQMLS